VSLIPARAARLATIGEAAKVELARWARPSRRLYPWLHPAVPVLDGTRYGLPRWQLYLGTREGRWIMAPREQSVILIGRSGKGKTRRVIAPNVLLWPGVVVATTTKRDLLDIVAPCRTHRGTVWCWDPCEQVGELPTGVRRLDLSLVAGCSDMTVARRRARALAQRAGRGVTDGDLWQDASVQLIALLLHAAALRGLPDAAVRSWVAQHRLDAAIEICAERGSADAHDTLRGLLNTRAGRSIDSLWFQVGTVWSALDTDPLRRSLARAARSTWNPIAFLRRPNTLVMVTPANAQEDLAALAVCLLEDVRAAALRLADATPGGALALPLLLALDECRNIAPIPSLANLLTTGRSRGIHVLAAFQHYAQAVHLWGSEAPGLVFSGATSVFFSDCGEREVTARLSELSGRRWIPQVTHGASRSAEGPFARWRLSEASHGRSEHQGVVEAPVYTEAEIRSIPSSCAWVLMPEAPLGLVEVADHQSVEPFPRWASMSPLVDVVPRGTAAGLPDAGDDEPWWRRLQVDGGER
jgi:type IV secretion system protein VirD4